MEQALRGRDIGFRLRARHPIIASIIFAHGAPDDETKFAILNGLLSNLDPGFPEDYRLLTEITLRRELVNTFSEHAMRRAVYDRIATICLEMAMSTSIGPSSNGKCKILNRRYATRGWH